MINLIRCDDRLVHGQCMTRLVQHYGIKNIIVIDEFTANDPMMKLIVESIAMPGMKNLVYTLDQAIEPIKAAIKDNVGTMIVFRFPLIAKELFDQIEDLPKSLMIGPVVKRDNTVTVQNGTYLSQEEVEGLDYLDAKGVEVFFQVVPDMKRIDYAEFKKKKSSFAKRR